MKPLSKRQREVLQKMQEGLALSVCDGTPFFNQRCFYVVHSATFNSLLNNEHIELMDTDVCYTITERGLTALAKPTRNRGKKKKPDLGDVQEKIMV